jgi:hypothetical protein
MEIELTKTNINSLPPDVIQKIALDFTYDEIRKLCRVSKRFEKLVCNSDTFWRNKLVRDFPDSREYIHEVEEPKKEYLLRWINIIDDDMASLIADFKAIKDPLKRRLTHAGRRRLRAKLDYDEDPSPATRKRLREREAEVNELKRELAMHEAAEEEDIRELRRQLNFFQRILDKL